MRTISPAECQRSREEREQEYWTSLAAKAAEPGAVIALDHRGERAWYWLIDAAEPMSSLPVTSRGFGGAHWRIRFRDGRDIETNNLWNGSVIPEPFHPRFAVNAELELLEAGPRS
jgi:hypothetical protein